MDVPCSVPLKNAWSPAGYQVVELLDPTGLPPPPKNDAADNSTVPVCAIVASSPVGYKVQLVSEEKVTPRRRRRDEDFPSIRCDGTRAAIWPWIASLAPFAMVGVVILGFASLSFVHNVAAPRRPVQLAVAADPVAFVVPANLDVAPAPIAQRIPDQNLLVIPKALQVGEGEAVEIAPQAPALFERNVPAAEPAGEAPPPAAQKPLAEFEPCGTLLGFVRNPKEAYRVAVDSNKLVFLLHVSGNFEDDRFT